MRSLAGPDARIVELPARAGSFEDASGVETGFPESRDALPVVRLYVTATGEELLAHSGYDLNIGRRVESALRTGLAELTE
ncbi:MAG: hypothetical protein GF400_03635 [Candidatus Eisenbacteria bacterium]|nr:hypothetical protein [Candidatus Eisenbacteria bacterium]